MSVCRRGRRNEGAGSAAARSPELEQHEVIVAPPPDRLGALPTQLRHHVRSESECPRSPPCSVKTLTHHARQRRARVGVHGSDRAPVATPIDSAVARDRRNWVVNTWRRPRTAAIAEHHRAAAPAAVSADRPPGPDHAFGVSREEDARDLGSRCRSGHGSTRGPHTGHRHTHTRAIDDTACDSLPAPNYGSSIIATGTQQALRRAPGRRGVVRRRLDDTRLGSIPSASATFAQIRSRCGASLGLSAISVASTLTMRAPGLRAALGSGAAARGSKRLPPRVRRGEVGSQIAQ